MLDGLTACARRPSAVAALHVSGMRARPVLKRGESYSKFNFVIRALADCRRACAGVDLVPHHATLAIGTQFSPNAVTLYANELYAIVFARC